MRQEIPLLKIGSDKYSLRLLCRDKLGRRFNMVKHNLASPGPNESNDYGGFHIPTGVTVIAAEWTCHIDVTPWECTGTDGLFRVPIIGPKCDTRPKKRWWQ